MTSTSDSSFARSPATPTNARRSSLAAADPDIDARPSRRWSLAAVHVGLLGWGLYASLRIVLQSFGLEPDTSLSLLLWYGIHEQGMPWLSSWVPTLDNWLLSLVPFHFLGFALVGPSRWVPIVMGWAIFVLSALVAAATTWNLGARRAAPFVFLALLNVGALAHLAGFATYSTSHNITNLLGLTSVLVLLRWQARPRIRWLIALLLLLSAGAISDPWMLPAYNLPIALAGFVVLARPTGRLTRLHGIALIGVAGFSILAVKTRLFGALDLLLIVHYARADWAQFTANSVYALRDIGGLLNIVPTTTMDALVPALVSVTALGAFVAWRTTRLVRVRESAQRLPLLFLTVAVTSIGGISAAMTLNGVDVALHSSRFLLNILYLVPILLAVLCTAASRGPSALRDDTIARRCGIGLFVLFVASSFVSNVAVVLRNDFRLKATGVDEIADFLRKHDVSYGYGPYWGSLANAVTVQTADEIRIRPVKFSPQTGELSTARPQTSTRWYTADDVPPGTRRFFVLVKNDGEECPVVTVCTAGLERQFGAPIETVAENGMVLLIWDHPLLQPSPAP